MFTGLAAVQAEAALMVPPWSTAGVLLVAAVLVGTVQEHHLRLIHGASAMRPGAFLPRIGGL